MAVGTSRLARGLSSIVVGASGLVGSALMRSAPGALGTYRTRAVKGLRALDASDRGALAALAEEANGDVIYLPAARPDVEWCETHPADAEEANLAPVRAATSVARDRGALLVAYSSDYVFDGTSGPYREDDATHPISAYGRIKERLERLVLEAGGLVIRTTGIFGREPQEPRNFVLRLVASLRHGDEVRVPQDQWSTPTYSDDLAAASVLLATRRETGVWHVAGADLVSRDELARRAARSFGITTGRIVPVPTSALGQKAARPLRGGLRIDKLRERTGFMPRSLDTALAHLAAIMEGRDG